ncbi:hypothetical protein D3C86_1777710 [compost metagenome]
MKLDRRTKDLSYEYSLPPSYEREAAGAICPAALCIEVRSNALARLLKRFLHFFHRVFVSCSASHKSLQESNLEIIEFLRESVPQFLHYLFEGVNVRMYRWTFEKDTQHDCGIREVS